MSLENFGNGRHTSNRRDNLTNLLHQELFDGVRQEAPGAALGPQEFLVLCQAGPDVQPPPMSQAARTQLCTDIIAVTRTGQGALPLEDRARLYASIQTRFANYAPDLQGGLNARGEAFARELNSRFRVLGDPGSCLHVTYVPQNDSGPARLEIRRGRLNDENQLVADGNALVGRPIYLFAQSDEGARAAQALAIVARDNIQDTRNANFAALIPILNNVGNNAANREQGLRQFINTQINPYLHWPQQEGQTRGWDIELVAAGPPIQIRVRAWDQVNNRLVAQGEAGYQARQPITIPNDAIAGAGGGNPGGGRGGQGGGQAGGGGDLTMRDAVTTLGWLVGAGLGLRYGLPAIGHAVNYFLHTRQLNQATLQALRARTAADLSQTEVNRTQARVNEQQALALEMGSTEGAERGALRERTGVAESTAATTGQAAMERPRTVQEFIQRINRELERPTTEGAENRISPDEVRFFQAMRRNLLSGNAQQRQEALEVMRDYFAPAGENSFSPTVNARLAEHFRREAQLATREGRAEDAAFCTRMSEALARGTPEQRSWARRCVIGMFGSPRRCLISGACITGGAIAIYVAARQLYHNYHNSTAEQQATPPPEVRGNN